MGSIFKPKMPPLPPPPPPVEAPSSEISDEEKAAIKAENDAIRRKRKGSRSTILTGPLGVQEDKKAAVETLQGKKD